MVSENGARARLRHGDLRPGDPAPGIDGFVLDDQCQPIDRIVDVTLDVVNAVRFGIDPPCDPNAPATVRNRAEKEIQHNPLTGDAIRNGDQSHLSFKRLISATRVGLWANADCPNNRGVAFMILDPPQPTGPSTHHRSTTDGSAS